MDGSVAAKSKTGSALMRKLNVTAPAAVPADAAAGLECSSSTVMIL